jgi:hypothetical protein
VAYLAALDRLAGTIAEARALAEILDCFAQQLRGGLPDPEGPPLDLFPTPARVRRVLECRDRALDAAEREWERLPADAREAMQPPGKLLADEVLE